MNDVYSVWNWEKGRYDYYRSNRPRPPRQRTGYPRAKGLKGVGEVPEQSVQPIPAGAQYVGEGDDPIGTIAQSHKRSALLFAGGAVVALLLLKGSSHEQL
jgi:hypothetical protein